MNKNTARLGEAPVNQLLLSLSLPAMVGMLVTALYNIVDTIFVAQGIGTAAVAAVGIAFPVQLVLMAIANSIGIGGAAIASQRLGQKQTDGASRAYANVLIAVFFISMLAIISAFIFVEPLLRLFGATDEIMPYSIDFLRVLLIGSPFVVFAARIAMYSNKPDWLAIVTRIIMPINKTIVPHSMYSNNAVSRSTMPMMTIASAPSKATIARLTFSLMMKP